MNALNADEIYQASRASVADGQKASDRSWRLDNGLSTRVFNALRRAGYASSLEGVDAEKLKADILNGKIWRARNVGQKTVRRLCEWLAAQTGARVAVLGVMANAFPDTETFIRFSEKNIKALLEAAGKDLP